MTRRPRAMARAGTAKADTRRAGDGAAPPVAAPGAIKVEFEAEIVGWPAGDRFDVVMRGQILSSGPVESFSVREAGGPELSVVLFGLGDAKTTGAAPDSGPRATGFQIYLPMPGGDIVRTADLTVSAASLDGARFEEPLRLGYLENKAAILEGPSRDMTGIELPAAPGIVYLEVAELTEDGFLVVAGWALARSPIVAVQVFAGETRLGAAAQGRAREDVGEAYPDYPNAILSGFLFERAAGDDLPGVSHVTVRTMCLSGACHAATIPLARPPGMPWRPAAAEDEGPTAGEAPAADTAPEIASEITPGATPPGPAMDLARPVLLICDSALLVATDTLRVEGWAACGYGIDRVQIEVDGMPQGIAEYGLERLDVAEEYAGLPAGIGFVFERTIRGLSTGPHEVRVAAISRAGDEKDIRVPIVDPAVPAFMFELDSPPTRDGIAGDPITGRMTIEGWALARDGMAGIEVMLDDTPLGVVHYGIARPDVGAAFPGWDGAARGGYTFHCPARALPDGEHVVKLIARSLAGETHERVFRIVVKKSADPEQFVSIRRHIGQVERDTTDALLTGLDARFAWHLIVCGDPGASPAARLSTLRSIVEQSWPDWHATVLAGDAEESAAVRVVMARFGGDAAARVRTLDPTDSEVWAAPLAAIGPGEAIAVLAIGDELGRDALTAFAIASGLRPGADMLYADEFRATADTTRPEGFFKPDFSPELLMSSNYIGRPLILKPALLAAVGATAASLTRDGLYDLVLRAAENASQVHHMPELLARTDGAEAANRDDGRAALAAALARRGIAADLTAGPAPGTWRVRRIDTVSGKVSIVIPTRASKNHIRVCLTSLRAMTGYKNYEIVCIDNIDPEDTDSKAFLREHADRIVEIPPPFNWSRFNNLAAEAATGEYLLFLNDDVEIVEPGWLDTMLEDAARPEVGIVGARLLYPNRTVQHAGMFLGANGEAGIGRHAFRYSGEHDPGYFGLALTRREVAAVTGACLLTRREVFERLGRFDEAHEIVNNDLDFCLRAHRAGLATIYTPHATLIHHELASREHLPDDFDTARFNDTWGDLFAAGDPYFNINLSRHSDDYRIDDEGVRAIQSGHPLIRREDVKNILAVKLDHIGDFVAALPAMRRLKTAFPGAKLTVLAAPVSAAFAAAEPAIDEFVPFEFFHTRSELGERELTADDFAALEAELIPRQFDIAIDLRKHMSTRHVLRHTGAKILAGYDSMDRYPWLHVALEWEGDKALQHKRNHIVDDLLHLVAALETSCEPARRLIDPRPPAMAVAEMPEVARPLFARSVVAIHPGAGNVTKQWPVAHVRALMGLLIARGDVSVLLIGGKDEAAVAAELAAAANCPERVASVVGEVALRDLPRLLAACALYIGNDSGPKHIAAAMGVPTIGVHSGVVDPGEWAPMGERTVALFRDMSCAPCYLSKAEDCPRGLACIRMLDPAPVFRMAEKFLARPVPIQAGSNTRENAAA